MRGEVQALHPDKHADFADDRYTLKHRRGTRGEGDKVHPAFGWTIFQALFMRGMARSYGESLRNTFLPELLSMNCLMGGMIPVMATAFAGNPEANDPTRPLFWFHMSVSLMAGFVVAYPMNWWLVANHLKHGMMTVRHPDDPSARAEHGMAMPGMATSTGPGGQPWTQDTRPTRHCR